MEYSINTINTNPFRAAVASYEGILVNQHLGLAEYLLIFEVSERGCLFIEQCRTPPPGGGDERWQALAEAINDCKYLLTCSAGQPPVEALAKRGITVFQVEGLIEDALSDLFQGKKLHNPAQRPGCRCETSGTAGQGCG